MNIQHTAKLPPSPSLEDEVYSMIITTIRGMFPQCADAELSLDTTFEELGTTSLEVVTVAFELEDAYGIQIHNESLDDFRSIRQARDIVVALVKGRRGQ